MEIPESPQSSDESRHQGLSRVHSQTVETTDDHQLLAEDIPGEFVRSRYRILDFRKASSQSLVKYPPFLASDFQEGKSETRQLETEFYHRLNFLLHPDCAHIDPSNT